MTRAVLPGMVEKSWTILLTLAQRQVAGRMPVVTFTVTTKALFVSLA